MFRHRAATALLLLAEAGLGSAQTPPLPIVESQSGRDFGYTVGSILQQRLVIEFPPGASLDTNALPAPGPVTDWLDLRAIRRQDRSHRRVELLVSYLVLKGVRNPEPVSVPPLVLTYRKGTQTAELQIPEWPFTLIPVIPPTIPDDKVVPRGPRAAPRFARRPHLAAMTALLSGVAACMLLVAWRQRWLPWFREQGPFAGALRELRRLSRRAKGEAAYAAGLKRVHRAIDETAGRAVFPAVLDEFLVQQPELACLRSEFERFFRASDRYFFDIRMLERALGERWRELEDFCRLCVEAERGGR